MDESDLRVREVAERLDLHANTVKRMLKRGELVGYRVGTRGDWRVTPEALEAFRTRKPDEGRFDVPSGT